jgi:hypothetical protein
VAADQLYFDESFRGWGNDDLEWGYRVCASGIPIVTADALVAGGAIVVPARPPSMIS